MNCERCEEEVSKPYVFFKRGEVHKGHKRCMAMLQYELRDKEHAEDDEPCE